MFCVYGVYAYGYMSVGTCRGRCVLCVEARGWCLVSALITLQCLPWKKWLSSAQPPSYMASAELPRSTRRYVNTCSSHCLNCIWSFRVRTTNDNWEKLWEGQWEGWKLDGLPPPNMTGTVITTPLLRDPHHPFWRKTGVLCKVYTCGKLASNFPFLSFTWVIVGSNAI